MRMRDGMQNQHQIHQHQRWCTSPWGSSWITSLIGPLTPTRSTGRGGVDCSSWGFIECVCVLRCWFCSNQKHQTSGQASQKGWLSARQEAGQMHPFNDLLCNAFSIVCFMLVYNTVDEGKWLLFMCYLTILISLQG